MKIIAHRANVNGADISTENHPDQIDLAISMGFDVEVDVRYDCGQEKLFLGHDEPQYTVSWNWLAKRKKYLWIHCKNLDALHEFSFGTSGFNYFWHQEDYYTLTSKNYIWTYPGHDFRANSVIVMPEIYTEKENLKDIATYDCYGVCTDYPQLIKP